MDIFEDVKKLLGYDYISDLRYHRAAAREALGRIDVSKYPADQIKDYLLYVAE